MKLAKLAYLVTVGLTLSLTGVGCRKNEDKLTVIPGNRNAGITDSAPRGPIDSQPPIGIDTPGGRNARPPKGEDLGPDGTKGPGKGPGPGENVGASTIDFSNMDENRDEFKAQTVYFEYDKSVVKASEIGKLEEVAKRMKSNFQGKALRIEGHCDERGTEEYNRSLGDRRATSIREKLVQFGLDPQILQTITFGEDKPVDPGHNEAAWSKNRRGELILLTPRGAN